MSDITNASVMPSIEQPWLRLYPEQLLAAREQLFMMQGRFTLCDYLKMMNSNNDAPVIEFYGSAYSLNDLLNEAEKVAKAMAALGVKVGDQICAFLRSVPEYIIILFASEKVGATLICRDGTLEEQLESLQYANAKILFAHDYTGKCEKEVYYNQSKLEHIIEITHDYYGKESEMPDHIIDNIKSLKSEEIAHDERDISWKDFIKTGECYEGEYLAPVDTSRPLCNPYTSGSTGPSKEIIHSASSMVGYLSQIAFPNKTSGKTVLLVLFPPTLIAILSSIILFNIAQTNRIILSPYCAENDIDLEFMRYRPWMIMTVPMMTDILKNSTRIPEDYDMSFCEALGGGADPMNNAWMRKTREWITKHNSKATYTQAYGLSECGSGVCMPIAGVPNINCNVGMPMPLTCVGIFDHNTNKELYYGKIGEICVQSTGSMLGYGGKAAESTADVIRIHPDGRRFIHTGDYGMINENGFIFHFSRGLQPRYGFEDNLYSLEIENKVCDINGIADCWLIPVRDKEHEGYFKPYLFVIPEKGYTVEELSERINEVLKPHERPIKIYEAEKREYFHFKLNRRILADRIYNSED